MGAYNVSLLSQNITSSFEKEGYACSVLKSWNEYVSAGWCTTETHTTVFFPACLQDRRPYHNQGTQDSFFFFNSLFTRSNKSTMKYCPQRRCCLTVSVACKKTSGRWKTSKCQITSETARQPRQAWGCLVFVYWEVFQKNSSYSHRAP
jgi:hypothetical protein